MSCVSSCIDRLKKLELALVALSAKNLLREVEESAKMDVGNTPQDPLEPALDDQIPIASKERAKIVLSVRDSDKEELKQFRLFMVCSYSATIPFCQYISLFTITVFVIRARCHLFAL